MSTVVGPTYRVRKYAGTAYGRRVTGVPVGITPVSIDVPCVCGEREARDGERETAEETGRYGVGRRTGWIVIRVGVRFNESWQYIRGLQT